MDSPKLVRWGGLAAMLGGIIGIVYAPFYALAYFATEDGAESLEAPGRRPGPERSGPSWSHCSLLPRPRSYT